MILLPDQLIQTRCVFQMSWLHCSLQFSDLRDLSWVMMLWCLMELVFHTHIFFYIQAVQSDFRTPTEANTLGTGNRAPVGSFLISSALRWTPRAAGMMRHSQMGRACSARGMGWTMRLSQGHEKYSLHCFTDATKNFPEDKYFQLAEDVPFIALSGAGSYTVV